MFSRATPGRPSALARWVGSSLGAPPLLYAPRRSPQAAGRPLAPTTLYTNEHARSRAGTATNDDAAAGKVGEVITCSATATSLINLSTGVAANIASMALTAGDWDISGSGLFTGSSLTTVYFTQFSISQSSGAVDSGTLGARSTLFTNSAAPFGAIALGHNIGPLRVSLGSVTSIYFVAAATFGTSTCGGYGLMRARRVR